MAKGKRKEKRSAMVKVKRLSLDDEACAILAEHAEVLGLPMQDVAGAAILAIPGYNFDRAEQFGVDARRLHKRRMTYQPALLD